MERTNLEALGLSANVWQRERRQLLKIFIIFLPCGFVDDLSVSRGRSSAGVGVGRRGLDGGDVEVGLLRRLQQSLGRLRREQCSI